MSNLLVALLLDGASSSSPGLDNNSSLGRSVMAELVHPGAHPHPQLSSVVILAAVLVLGQ